MSRDAERAANMISEAASSASSAAREIDRAFGNLSAGWLIENLQRLTAELQQVPVDLREQLDRADAKDQRIAAIEAEVATERGLKEAAMKVAEDLLGPYEERIKELEAEVARLKGERAAVDAETLRLAERTVDEYERQTESWAASGEDSTAMERVEDYRAAGRALRAVLEAARKP